MIPEGEYLLTHVGFSRDEKPTLTFQQNAGTFRLEPLGHTFSLRFNTATRHCVGWYDITKGENFICPEASETGGKYEQCPACQKRTGFNPAFYNATSVSPQQEQRNLEPHFLYLAHFAPGVVKVGISHAARGRARLLEQGARTAVILDTFPTAHIARQYEARIAALPTIAEALQVRKKIELITKPYNPTQGSGELIETRKRIETTLGTTFSSSPPISLNDRFFVGEISLTDATDMTDRSVISGESVGMAGGILFCKHQDTPLFISIKKFTGYPVTFIPREMMLDLPSQQISLF